MNDGYHRDELLKTTVATAVPLLMRDIERRGGITAADVRRAQSYGDIMRSAGKNDASTIIILTKKDTAYTTSLLCKMVAVLAFCPGGITIAGMHFEGKPTYE